MPNIPHKFAIRFYGTVEHNKCYLHSLLDSKVGNRTCLSPASNYFNVFRHLRGCFNRKPDEKIVNKESASALRCLQIMHQTISFPRPQRRLVVCDNFYTRHLLANQLSKFTGREINMLGIVRYGSIYSVNITAVKEAIKSLNKEERGTWFLFQAFDSKTKKEQGKKTKSLPIIAEKCGYIVFKDRLIVTFFTNDLKQTPSRRIAGPFSIRTDYMHSQSCVHGIRPLPR